MNMYIIPFLNIFGFMAYHNNYLAERGSKTPIINLFYSKSYRCLPV